MPTLRNRPLSLNLDKDIRELAEGEMSEAINIATLSYDADGRLVGKNLKGNVLVDSTYTLPAGENFVIGKRENESKNAIYYAIWNSNKTHRLVRYSTANNKIETLIQNELFRWNKHTFVDIAVVNVPNNEYVYLVDKHNTPIKINVKKALAGEYVGLSKEDFTAIMEPPAIQPTIVLQQDTGFPRNLIIQKAFQFAYRYIYFDGEISVFSPVSQIAIDPIVFDVGLSVNELYKLSSNKIVVTCNYGGKFVQFVEVIARNGNDGVWYLVHTQDNQYGTASFSFDFYNDGNYSAVSLEDAYGNYDFIPLRAEAISFAEGRLLYANSVDSYDNIEIDVSMAPSYKVVEESASVESISSKGGTASITPFDGIFGVGDVVKLDWTGSTEEGYTYTSGGPIFVVLNTYYDSQVVSYNVQTGDTIDDIGAAIVALIAVSLPIAVSVTYNSTTNSIIFNWTDTDEYKTVISFTISLNHLETGVNSGSSYKAGASHLHGIVYFNEFLQDGTVQLSDDCKVFVEDFYQRKNERYGISKIDYQIKHQPPIWAKYWTWVYSGNISYDMFLQYSVINAFKSTSASKAIYLSLNGLQGKDWSYVENYSALLDYKFVEGDYIKVIKHYSSTTDSYTHVRQSILARIISLEYLEPNATTNPIYNPSAADKTTGYFLLVDNPSVDDWSFDDVNDNTSLWQTSDSVVIEIFRPLKLTENIPYYEVGGIKPVLNPGTDNRSHGGTTVPGNASVTGVQYLMSGEILLEIPKDGYGDECEYIIGDIISVVGQTGTWTVTRIVNRYTSLTIRVYVTQTTGSYAFVGGETITLASTYARGTLSCGDVYFRGRIMAKDETTGVLFKETYCEDAAYSDFIPNAKHYCRGRAHYFNKYNKQQKRGSSFWATQPIQEYGSFNGLSTIRAVNTQYKDYEMTYGDIKRVIKSGESLFVVFESRVVRIDLSAQIIQTLDAEQMITLSNQLLSDLKAYQGDYGVGAYNEAVDVYDGKLYFADIVRGRYLRLSNDGITPISMYGVESAASATARSGSAASNNRGIRVSVGIDPSEQDVYFTVKGASASQITSLELGNNWTNIVGVSINSNIVSFPIIYSIIPGTTPLQSIEEIIRNGQLLIGEIDWYKGDTVTFTLRIQFDLQSQSFSATYNITTGVVSFNGTHIGTGEETTTCVLSVGTVTPTSTTVFSEPNNKWFTQTSFYPAEGYVKFGQYMYAFQNGLPYAHNGVNNGQRSKYFGVTAEHYYVIPINQEQAFVKLLLSLSTESNLPFDCLVTSNLTTTNWYKADWQKREGIYYKGVSFDTSAASSANRTGIGTVASIPSSGRYNILGFNPTSSFLREGDAVFVNGTQQATIISLHDGYIILNVTGAILVTDYLYVVRDGRTHGDSMRGSYFLIKLSSTTSSLQTLFAVNGLIAESTHAHTNGN